MTYAEEMCVALVTDLMLQGQQPSPSALQFPCGVLPSLLDLEGGVLLLLLRAGRLW